MRIAVAQTPGTRLEDWRDTLTLVVDLIQQAAGVGAGVVVLPECVWPAYCLGSKERYRTARANGLPAPNEFLSRVQRVAQDQQIGICVGFVEEVGERLLNSAAVIDRSGKLLGTRQKCFLWSFDHDYFDAGDRIEPVETDFGRVGVMICADARLPEIPATLAARGAELLLQPTAWVNAGTPEEPWNPQPDFIIAARAEEFGVPVASASKWGDELGTEFIGSSLICDHEGRVLAQCGQRETTVIVADVEPRKPRLPVLDEKQREALLSATPPRQPRGDVPPVRIAPLPQNVGPDEAKETDSSALAVGYDATVQPVGMLRLGGFRKPRGMEGTVIGELCQADNVHVGLSHVNEALCFAHLRHLALLGVHLVIVYPKHDEEVSFTILRARACENRVFVLAVLADGWSVIGPRGRVVRAGRWPARADAGEVITLDVAQAADKEVAPRTNTLAGRRPELYAL